MGVTRNLSNRSIIALDIFRRDERPDRRSSKPNERSSMSRHAPVVLYGVAMVAVIVGVDFVFFRNRLWERLMVNVGIVLVFLAFYFRFLKR
jgi:uncharacterized membrane protein